MTRTIVTRYLALAAIATSMACAAKAPSYSASCLGSTCALAMTSYAVEVASAGTDTLAATEFTQLTLDTTTGVLALEIPTAARVSGRVLSGDTPVPGSVVFTRPSRIPGRPAVYYETTIDADTGAYSVGMPPNINGEKYTINVQPTDATTFPPATLTQTITSDTSLDLPLPAGSDLVTVHGSLATAVSAAVGQATVVLRDAASLAALSTTSTTSSTGTFELKVGADALSSADGLLLVAQSGDVMSGQLTVTLPLTVAQVMATNMQTPMTRLQLPALPATTHLTVPVVGASSSGTLTPVIGAAYRLVATLDAAAVLGGAATLQVTHEIDGVTDMDGKISADLYSDAAGTRAYTVTIVPPTNNDTMQNAYMFQSMTSAITVGTTSGVTQQLTLQPRPTVTGIVVDSSNNPITGATLQPALSTVVSTLGTASLISTTSATAPPTLKDGRFALYVDPATYDISVSPPANEVLARRWLSRQAISGDVDLAPVVLTAAVMFDVTVTDSSQAAVQGSVRLYVVPGSDPACAQYATPTNTTATCVPAPQLQAEVTTDDGGRATMLLPSQ